MHIEDDEVEKEWLSIGALILMGEQTNITGCFQFFCSKIKRLKSRIDTWKVHYLRSGLFSRRAD
jgi:hypothetical protein